jgi:ankyrin repeat protein
MKMGADISQNMEDYPDLTPLYLTLPGSLITSPKELDSALRIACSYALPRTTGFLLTRGANANTASIYGTAAIHSAVMRRRPWHELYIVHYFLSLKCRDNVLIWESMVLQTVSTLLDFGADVDLRTRISRTHECRPDCWRSIDCDNPGQTALHIASASGMLTIVSRLLDAGADPNLPDEQGYMALYASLVQGHGEIACHILERCYDLVNPVVYIREQSTALHIACRFSFPQMVGELLNKGAEPDTIDSHGRTPFHDVLEWARLDREEEVILTLDLLVQFGANPDITNHNPTLRQLAESHAFKSVRNMFSVRQGRVLVTRAGLCLASPDYNVYDGTYKDNHLVESQRELGSCEK